MPKERNYYLDNVKGILIFLVVFAHFLLLYVEDHVTSLPLRVVYFFYF
jgi:fucose 4-O-acetylase-like acetyltransferase